MYAQLRFASTATLALLCLTCGAPDAAPTAQKTAPSDLVIQAPGRTIRLPSVGWKPMKNEFEWAENFEQSEKSARQRYPRVVTVFKLPMSEDRRSGVRISPGEYLELFVSSPGTLSALLRVDKGKYWVLSRDGFVVPDTVQINPVLSDAAFARVQFEFQGEIDSARYLLQSVF
jgi:hypothetical protein